MKYSDIDKVNQLVEMLEQTRKSIRQIKEWIQNEDCRKVVGSEFGFSTHYNMVICEHRDGSGMKVNLSGYHYNAAILEAIRSELDQRENTYIQLLTELGVEIPNKFEV